MRKFFTGTAILVAAAVVLAVYRRPQLPQEIAFSGGRNLPVKSSLAQLPVPKDTLDFGDRVVVLGREFERRGEFARIRTERGETGWVDASWLLAPELWQQAQELRRQADPLRAQALARTKFTTNARIEPGRNHPRIFQFGSDVPVEILARRVVEWSPPAAAPHGAYPQAADAAGESEAEIPPVRREDWLLVRGIAEPEKDATGWVLGRFLEMSQPAPLREYAAGIRFVAWFDLGTVMDVAGPRPTYLAVGETGPEGQPCDFTLLRVFVWSVERGRYETAYVDSGFCGRFPVRAEPEAYVGSEAAFSFLALGRKGPEQREYRLREGIVHRLRQTAAP